MAPVLSSKVALIPEERESNIKDSSWSHFSAQSASFSSQKVWRLMLGLN